MCEYDSHKHENLALKAITFAMHTVSTPFFGQG